MPTDPSSPFPPPAILFTAFEPSGDDHAAAVISVLRSRHADLPIYAWGGRKMEAAGATIIERTGDDAVMGVPGLKKIREHRQMNRRIGTWLASHRIAVHVPVDSPAANFPVCRLTKARGAKVVHLVAPQLWAWGSWRAKKLRRLTDLVLCLLPFEQDWFRKRGIPAEFIGHPLFDHALDASALAARLAEIPQSSPRILLLPGSRPAELAKNFPILLEAFRSLARERTAATGLVAVTRPEVETRLRTMAASLGGWPDRLSMVSGATDAAIHWCELALVVSGTVTLQVAKQHRPMVIVYKSNPFAYALLGWWVIDTEFFTLPNLIAGREIVPELVPHFGDASAVIDAAKGILDSPPRAAQQIADLHKVTDLFQGRQAGAAAANAIERVAGLVTAPAM